MGASNQALFFLAIVCFLSPTLMEVSSGFQYKVGDSNGWSVPKSNMETKTYTQWAQEKRFQVGDALLFVYNASVDSVLQVTSEDDYNNCRTSAAIKSFKDGYTVFTLNQSGSFFFISGNTDNCQKSEKLHVIVMSIRGHKSKSVSPAPAPATAAVSTPISAPASAPVSTPLSAPAPAPSFEENAPAPSPEPMPPTTAAASPLFHPSGTALTLFLATLLSYSLM